MKKWGTALVLIAGGMNFLGCDQIQHSSCRLHVQTTGKNALFGEEIDSEYVRTEMHPEVTAVLKEKGYLPFFGRTPVEDPAIELFIRTGEKTVPARHLAHQTIPQKKICIVKAKICMNGLCIDHKNWSFLSEGRLASDALEKEIADAEGIISPVPCLDAFMDSFARRLRLEDSIPACEKEE